MKGLDVFIVRFLPFILFIITGINTICCVSGIDVRDGYYLHSHSIIYASAFFVVSLANKRYHCVWNRAMYIYLIIVPLLNFLDKKLDFIPYDYWSFVVIVVLYLSVAAITAYLAIRHFVNASKRRLEHGN